MRALLKPLKEDKASVDNVVRTVITNFLQPTKPLQPKTIKQCLPLVTEVEHTSQPLYGLSVLELADARKRVLQRLNVMETVETVVMKPHPPSRIPVLQKKNARKGQEHLKASLIAQLDKKACVPPMLMPLGPIQKKMRPNERSGVVMDIYVHSLEPLKAVHGVNMAAKPPLPPIRARDTVPIKDAEKVPLKPVRPEGSPRRSTFRRRVVKSPVQAELMASLKAKLFTVLEELIIMQSWEEMDAEALEEKAAKEKLMANIWQQIGNNNLIQEDCDLWELFTDYQEEEERRMEKRVN
ncbi:hypothetical protein DPEC_G00209200 [Dallia pectoralis]|uniref:Uncharacterized protein n=1 Tax=Dallia pectoralis TaxID=75939 RepID=A0ACC2G5G8_DALPE|nr:hypothetical protein DPEC_G00209200 [Dallia pectoralis]